MSEKMSFGLGATLYSFNIDYYTHFVLKCQ